MVPYTFVFYYAVFLTGESVFHRKKLTVAVRSFASDIAQ